MQFLFVVTVRCPDSRPEEKGDLFPTTLQLVFCLNDGRYSTPRMYIRPDTNIAIATDDDRGPDGSDGSHKLENSDTRKPCRRSTDIRIQSNPIM